MNPSETVAASARCQRAWSALPARERGKVLRAIAAALDQSRSLIIAAAASETSLTDAELAPEFSRMTRTLEMFAALVEEGKWVRAAVSPAESDPSSAIGPNHDVRSMLIPLRGAVIVFGASNFPLAYGVCGGDTASALAAGCPVVVKEHPAHRNTGRLIASIARDAIKSARFDPDLLGYVEDDGKDTPALAKSLVEHRNAAAVGFTGSTSVGSTLIKIANARPIPIPVFAEMGSVNPNIVFPGALAARGPAIAQQLASSIAARHGQQCTCPGIVLVPSNDHFFASMLEDELGKSPARTMLSENVRTGFQRSVAKVAAALGEDVSEHPDGSDKTVPLVLRAPTRAGLEFSEVLETEMFGPAAVVLSGTMEESRAVIETLPGSLTISLWFDDSDLEQVRGLLPEVAARTGRIIFNGVPTGVRVAEGMVHGGPWPATNRPESTAVGPRAIERWCRPVCYQNYRQWDDLSAEPGK
ncbi:MAG: aldehyde dehydrogenase family protein [Phycisphaeraceae bacterium]|nr:aldehyde dehydrogenase family protein [Phycisphaeraceae bacterium]